MPLASALELVLGHYDIYDVDSLLAILRSPHDASGVADLIDGSRALIDATVMRQRALDLSSLTLLHIKRRVKPIPRSRDIGTASQGIVVLEPDRTYP